MSQVSKNLDAAVEKIIDAAKRGMLVAGEHVLGVSNSQVPLEEGDLARSGAVSQDGRSGRTAISYDTPYAARQHEEIGWRHDPGRNAKYLENAVNSERATALRIVAQRARGAF